MFKFVSLSLCAVIAPAAFGANPASDRASNAPYVLSTWTAGQNGGYGFTPWQFESSVNPSGAVGFFLGTTTGNLDLNFIATEATPNNPVRFGWGTFANDGTPIGSVPGLRLAAARRGLSGDPLAVGQTLEVWFEHGSIRTGNLNPQNGLRDGGWAGITLRPGDWVFPFADPFAPTGEVFGSFGFGFQGGNQNYTVYDGQAPSGRDSGVAFTRDGLQLEFTLTGANTYSLAIFSAASGTLLNTITGPVSGSIGAVVLHNRNTEDNDVFFNLLNVSNLCVADTDDGTGSGTPDGGVGIEDLLYYLGQYDAGSLVADVDDGSGTGIRDGGVGIEDLLYFLGRYDAGC